MSVIITNMDMPESCFECRLCYVDNDLDCAWCMVRHDYDEWPDSACIPTTERHKDCPLRWL